MVHAFPPYILRLLLSDVFIINFPLTGGFLEWKYKELATFFCKRVHNVKLNAMKICRDLIILYFSCPRKMTRSIC